MKQNYRTMIKIAILLIIFALFYTVLFLINNPIEAGLDRLSVVTLQIKLSKIVTIFTCLLFLISAITLIYNNSKPFFKNLEIANTILFVCVIINILAFSVFNFLLFDIVYSFALSIHYHLKYLLTISVVSCITLNIFSVLKMNSMLKCLYVNYNSVCLKKTLFYVVRIVMSIVMFIFAYGILGNIYEVTSFNHFLKFIMVILLSAIALLILCYTSNPSVNIKLFLNTMYIISVSVVSICMYRSGENLAVLEGDFPTKYLNTQNVLCVYMLVLSIVVFITYKIVITKSLKKI